MIEYRYGIRNAGYAAVQCSGATVPQIFLREMERPVMSSRSQAIADILTRAIIDHRLVPGCKLGERELAEIFEVSRIVIRQALIRLAYDGLAQIERNRGAFVARPSMQEAMEIYDALTLVEQGVAAQLCDRLGRPASPSCASTSSGSARPSHPATTRLPTFSARSFTLSSSASAVTRSCRKFTRSSCGAPRSCAR